MEATYLYTIIPNNSVLCTAILTITTFDIDFLLYIIDRTRCNNNLLFSLMFLNNYHLYRFSLYAFCSLLLYIIVWKNSLKSCSKKSKSLEDRRSSVDSEQVTV